MFNLILPTLKMVLTPIMKFFKANSQRKTRPVPEPVTFQQSGIPGNFETIKSGLDFNINPNALNEVDHGKELKARFTSGALPIFIVTLILLHFLTTMAFCEEKIQLSKILFDSFEIIKKITLLVIEHTKMEVKRDWREYRKTLSITVTGAILSLFVAIVIYIIIHEWDLIDNKELEFGKLASFSIDRLPGAMQGVSLKIELATLAPCDQPFLPLISALRCYPVGLFSKKSKLPLKDGSYQLWIY